MIPIPKLSAPLVKDIRTGEGIAEWVLGTAVGVLTACGDLHVAQGATFLTILAAVKGIRRTFIKVAAIQAPFGIGAPEQPAVVRKVEGDVEAVAASVAAPPVDPGTTDKVTP